MLMRVVADDGAGEGGVRVRKALFDEGAVEAFAAVGGRDEVAEEIHAAGGVEGVVDFFDVEGAGGEPGHAYDGVGGGVGGDQGLGGLAEHAERPCGREAVGGAELVERLGEGIVGGGKE